MAASNLLALIDDIATLLDDVAVLSKVAAKKTAGVLGDDLALNAQQVSGVSADRELHVVWEVAKGSLLNKIILVPSALLISALYPPLIIILMIVGGLYLCFEGAEKLVHRFLPHDEDENAHQQRLAALSDPQIDIVALEKDKIKGAIRTDFILSAEIIVIVLGTVQASAFSTQIMVLSGLALLFTVGVYGLVAAIVKLDDLGLHLQKKASDTLNGRIQRHIGNGLLWFAPWLMKTLSVVGTAAMFLVGGGILVHSVPVLHYLAQQLLAVINPLTGELFISINSILVDGIAGLLAGILVVFIWLAGNGAWQKLR